MSAAALSNSPIRRPLFWMPISCTCWAAILTTVGWLGMQTLSIVSRHHWISLRHVRAFVHENPQTVLPFWIAYTFLYACTRLTRYHPALRPQYFAHLMGMPWTPDRPLPVGPAQLVWEDLVPTAAVALFCLTPIGPLTLFAGLFAALAIFVSRPARDRKWFAAVAAILAGGITLAWPVTWQAMAIELALIAVADIVVLRSFADLPWALAVDRHTRAERKRLESSGWLLAPVPPLPAIPPRVGWTTALVVGWCAYCVLTAAGRQSAEDAAPVQAIVVAAMFVLPFIRCLRYCATFQPPISIWGRLWTGRLIVPAYDHVLIAPLAACIAAGAAIWIGYEMQVDTALSYAVGTFAAWAITLNAGPTVARWQLTGGHRIVRPPQGNSRRRELAVSTPGGA